MRETGAEGGRLAEVPAEANDPNARVRGVQVFQNPEAAVRAAVVDKDDFVVVPPLQSPRDLLVQGREIILFIQQGHHDRQSRAVP